MKITKGELKKIAQNCADVEIYITTEKHSCFYANYCRSCYLDLDELPVIFEGNYEVMNERDYNNTIGIHADCSKNFAEWYGNKDAKVLCVLIY